MYFYYNMIFFNFSLNKFLLTPHLHFSHGFMLLSSLLPVLLIVAFFTLIERRLMGQAQRRRGPNVIGLYGLFQAIADGAKLFFKEIIFPLNANIYIYIFGPFLVFFLALTAWFIIPLTVYDNNGLNNYTYGLLLLYAISSFGVYGILLSGWASNSKYSILGALRSTAQMISYELSIGFVFLFICTLSFSFDLKTIILKQSDFWNIIKIFPIFILFLITILAETNRHPFDLPEAEAELVAGYNTEYSGMKFALFFLGEYANMFLMSCLTVIFFLGGGFKFIHIYSLNFSIKAILLMFFFIWSRILLPRYRYDQLMNIGWKILFPIIFSIFVFQLCLIKTITINSIINKLTNSFFYF